MIGAAAALCGVYVGTVSYTHLDVYKRQQPEFTLIEGFVTPEGEKVRAERYRADFSYTRGGERIVEDVKGHRTKEYLIKRKQMLDKYGISVREV